MSKKRSYTQGGTPAPAVAADTGADNEEDAEAEVVIEEVDEEDLGDPEQEFA